MEQNELVCPFRDTDKDCGFKTTSDEEYLTHTKIHKPSVMEDEPRLYEKRLQLAKVYADKSIKKRPHDFAYYVWKTKPKNQECGVWSAMLQDWGVTDTDNYAGLSMYTGSLGID